MFTTIAENVTLDFSAVSLTGDVEFSPERHALMLTDPFEPGEVMTTNLSAYGYEARADTVFIKDWSEHTGLAKSLEKAGVVEIIRALNVGPFRSRAYEVRVLAAVAVPTLEPAAA